MFSVRICSGLFSLVFGGIGVWYLLIDLGFGLLS